MGINVDLKKRLYLNGLKVWAFCNPSKRGYPTTAICEDCLKATQCRELGLITSVYTSKTVMCANDNCPNYARYKVEIPELSDIEHLKFLEDESERKKRES